MTPSAIRQPCQARSHRTMARILEATENLLQERSFEQITIQAIVRRARTSVGAFYTRFQNKEALLPALYDRYDATMPRTPEGFGLRPARDLAERVEQIVAKMIELFLARRGLLRAMSLHARAHPETIPAQTRECRRRLHRAIGDLVFEFHDEIDHPDPRLAIDLGLFMISATFRDKLLFPEAPHAAAVGAIAPERLGAEMARALLCYLRGSKADAEPPS